MNQHLKRPIYIIGRSALTKMKETKIDWKMKTILTKIGIAEKKKRKMKIVITGLKLMHLGVIIPFAFLFDHLKMSRL